MSVLAVPKVVTVSGQRWSARRASRFNDDGKAANSLRIRNLENACEEKFVTPHAYPPSSVLSVFLPSVPRPVSQSLSLTFYFGLEQTSSF